jgi:Na+/H+ antiporter NhaD/arsenite permease-like protein
VEQKPGGLAQLLLLPSIEPAMHLLSFLATAGDVPLWLTAPFALLLILIAVMPLSPAKHFWERYYAPTAISLGLAVAGYFSLRLPDGPTAVLHTAREYFSFISLVGSLFVVAGGIHLKVKGETTPLANLVFLAIGAVATNFIGTTGASVLLIRPFIRMNQNRVSAYHIVFFIFVVSNCGGMLTPIGNPPLLMGFLYGVPFFWLIGPVIGQWLVAVGAILAVFFLIDQRSYRRARPAAHARMKEPDAWGFQGGINLVLLLVIIGAVFLPDRFLMREFVMLGASLVSWRFTPKLVHEKNHFTFGPIKEVAFLFFGIFLTMMPTLGYIDRHGAEFSVRQPVQYYLATGGLSAVLDNAPAYATFLRLAEASVRPELTTGAPARPPTEADTIASMCANPAGARLIIAVSLGAVFFGGMTYLGNGPNFMVKAIAESSGVKVPSFAGYMLGYSLPILLPILLASGWLFL